MTLNLLSLQQLPPTPTGSVKEILAWVIGILLLFIGVMFVYFKNEIKTVREQLEKEREYSKAQDKDSVKLFTEITLFLQQNVMITDKNSEALNKVVSIQNSVSSKIDEILRHLKP